MQDCIGEVSIMEFSETLVRNFVWNKNLKIGNMYYFEVSERTTGVLLSCHLCLKVTPFL